MGSRRLDDDELRRATDKVRRSWAKQAGKYDKAMGFFERRVFGPEHRAWACSKATGDTLEVAVGTGLNLPLYPPGVSLTGVDLSDEMLEVARRRALGREVDLRRGEAHALPFPDESFDTVVCTYSLCNIPDVGRAIAEMRRVLRPAGALVLVDHVRSNVRPVYWVQKAIEAFTGRLEGEHMTRRPLGDVLAEGLAVVERSRHGAGAVVERMVAVKPAED